MPMYGSAVFRQVDINLRSPCSAESNDEMRYLEPLIGFLAFLWFLIACLLQGRGLRDWQHRAQALLGLSGMSLFGLILYGMVHAEQSTYSFRAPKMLLGGIAIGIFVTLWLEGSMNILKKAGKRGQSASGGVTQ
jgi:hypothetical protein